MNSQQLSVEAQSSLKHLATLISVAQASAETHAKATHERFNVFTTLLKENDEVRLHTRFLHCLLDPEGSHGCETLFLDLFFKTLETLKVLDCDGNEEDFHAPPVRVKWTLRKEASCGDHGQIDLLFDSVGFGYAIENKLNAKEQTEQLSRYAAYLRSRYGKAYCLIYLTHHGKAGYTAYDERYIRISYEKHIASWLEECLKASYHIVPLNQVLLQYRALVRRITRQNPNSKFMEPVANFIRNNPELIRLNTAIQEAIKTASEAAWAELEREIALYFEDSYRITLHRNIGLASGSSALIFEPLGGGIFHEAPFEVWAERDEDGFGIGICSDRKKLEPNGLIDRIHEKMRHSSELATTRFPVGWHILLGESLDEQTAQLMSPNCSARVCVGIRTYLDLLESAYIEANEAPDTLDG